MSLYCFCNLMFPKRSQFPWTPLRDKFLTNNLPPGSRVPRHGPDFNFLCTSFSFLPVDFVSVTSKANSISFFQLSRYSLWLHLGGESFYRSMRSIGSRGFYQTLDSVVSILSYYVWYNCRHITLLR